jgi:hypothetical protein
MSTGRPTNANAGMSTQSTNASSGMSTRPTNANPNAGMSTRPTNANPNAGMSAQPQTPLDRHAPDPTGYDPEMYRILFGPPKAKGVQCAAYNQPLDEPAADDEAGDEPEGNTSSEASEILNGPPRASGVEAPASSNPLRQPRR